VSQKHRPFGNGQRNPSSGHGRKSIDPAEPGASSDRRALDVSTLTSQGLTHPDDLLGAHDDHANAD